MDSRSLLFKIGNGTSIKPKGYYYKLFLRFFSFSLFTAAVPLLLIALYIHSSYSAYSNNRMAESFRRRVESCRSIIQLFLSERLNDLQLIFRTHPVSYLKQESDLKMMFREVNRDGEYFNDLGIIDQRGFYVSYVGPYDLRSNDYSITPWFTELMKKTVYISDVFLGYRNYPHFIMAVLRQEGGANWILRATVATESLSLLLAGVNIGKTSEVFLLNDKGVYQTTSESGGTVMERSYFDLKDFSDESGIKIIGNKIVAFSWLKEPHWLLIVQQDYSEFFADREFADHATLGFLGVSLFSLLFVALISMSYIVRNIKRMDRQTIDLSKKLIISEKMATLGQLAAGVAHEINNPLAIIQSEIDLMRENEHPSTAVGSLSNIEDQIDRCSRIIRNLLGFSRRIKSGRQPLDINELIKEVQTLYMKWASTAGISIVANLSEELPMVVADPFEIGQILINLVSNAIDAYEGNGGGTIQIGSWADRGEFLHVSVTDFGCGILEKDLKLIFDPFFTTKRAGKGAGLGLAICCSIMQNHGGQIAVKSKYGEGTELFCLFLSAMQRRQKTMNSPKILLIDDEIAFVRNMSELLKRRGYEVSTTESGTEGIRLLQDNNCDVVVLDLRMPGLSGIEVLKRIRTEKKTAPEVIILTGFATIDSASECLEYGACDLISKPVKIQDLVERISKAFHRKLIKEGKYSYVDN